LLVALFRRFWTYNLATVLVANGISAVVCVALGTFGYGNLVKGLNYLIPQAIVFVLTALQLRGWRRTAS
jgi:hypothetical protein